MNGRVPFAALSTLLSVLMIATIGSAQTGAAPPVKDPTVAVSDYRIGSEDTIQISVWKNEPMSRTVPVRPDGKISLPLVNDVQVAGLTPMELRDVLINKMKEYIPAPEVSVIVIEPKSFKVSVIGEVPRPGRYELRSKTTMLDLLAMVGGVTQFAARSKIVVIRRDDTNQKKIPFNYNRALSADPEQDNFFLQPNDIVVVP